MLPLGGVRLCNLDLSQLSYSRAHPWTPCFFPSGHKHALTVIMILQGRNRPSENQPKEAPECFQEMQGSLWCRREELRHGESCSVLGPDASGHTPRELLEAISAGAATLAKG